MLATWPLTTTLDSKLAVVPKHGDRIALYEFQDEIMTWSFLTHMVTSRVYQYVTLSTCPPSRMG